MFRTAARLAAPAAVALLAACADQPTAPAAPAALRPADAPSALLTGTVPTVWLTMRVVNSKGAAIGGATFSVQSGGNRPIYVKDNDANDGNPNAGGISVKVAKASLYSACIQEPPSSAFVTQLPLCSSSTSTSNLVVDMGTFKMYERPEINLVFKDQFGQIAPGATLSITSSPDIWNTMITDGGAGDLSAGMNGAIRLYLPYANAETVYTFCQTAAGTGFAIASPSCWQRKYDYDTKYQESIVNRGPDIKITPLPTIGF